MIPITALIFGILTFIVIYLGGTVTIKLKKYLSPLIAFCGGTLVAAALLDVIPEALEILDKKSAIFTFTIIIASFLFFHILDKLVFIHSHSHGEDCAEHSHTLGKLSASGIIIHTFLDGLAIGTGFLVNNTTGFLIATVILLHDFADGVSTVTVLLRHKHKQVTTQLFLIAASISPLIGILAAEAIKPSEQFLGYLLAIFGGFFLYIGATDLLPEAHKERSSIKLVLLTVFGAVIIGLIRFIAG